MEIRVLGRIEAIDDGPLQLGGATQRRLLAALAASRGAVVSVDRLADVTWPEDAAPDDPHRNIRSYINRLRNALAGVRDRIETVGDGYRLALGPGELDLERFEDCADSARRAAEHGDHLQALDAAQRGLSLWAGRPFAEFGDEPWAFGDVARLNEVHIGLRELRAELLIGASDGASAVADLEALSQDHPYRERPRALLIQALAHSGRQAEALRSFRDFRRTLIDEIGIEPSDELVTLDRSIAAGTLEPARQPGLRAVGDFDLHERIGEGAFAVVYRATQRSLRRDVAVKIIRSELANRAEFVRRFEAEAQMVARIEHPSVVPLYDYWREPDRAFLIMRLMTGGTLEQRLDDGPIELAAAADVVDQLAGALTAAHGAGVVHRDVKPENVMFDADGLAYLCDFGIALESAESAMPEAALSEGSPLFASPEQLLREPVGPEADVYALAVVTYSMLIGHAPFAEPRDQATRLDRQLHEPLPSLHEQRPELPSGIDAIISAATTKLPTQRLATPAAFARGFREAITEGDVPRSSITERVPPQNPYRGLRAFDVTDSPTFFGRERLVDEIVAALDRPDSGFVAVVGPSGSGKSSAVRAGVLPAIRAGRIRGSAKWFITAMSPGARPFERLETALLRVAVNPPGSLIEQLRAGDRGILRSVRRILPDDDTELLIVVDQFEELFANTVDRVDREAFITGLLTAATEPATPLRVIVTLRVDFLEHALRDAALASLLKAHMVTVTPLATDELEHAIVDPAALVGASFEPGLVARIIADVARQPGALPLLQYALMRMYEHSDRRLIRRADYEAVGGIAGAIARRADELFSGGSVAGARCRPAVVRTPRTARRRRARHPTTSGAGGIRRRSGNVGGHRPVRQGAPVDVRSRSGVTRSHHRARP